MKNTKLNIFNYRDIRGYKYTGKNPQCVFLYSKCFVLYLQEFPFFTLTSFPPGFLVHVGGVVSARSVKLLDRIHNPGEFSAHKRAMSFMYR